MFILLYFLRLEAAAGDVPDPQLIVNLTVSFATIHSSTCIEILNDAENLNNSHVFDIYKRLSTSLSQSVGFYAYDLSIDPVQIPCLKPIRLLIGEGPRVRRKFVKVTRKIQMANSLWLIILSTPILEFLSEARIPFDVELVAAKVTSKDRVDLYEVYQVGDDNPLRMTRLGKWTRSDGLDILMNGLYDRRSDLEGKVIRTGSIENWPMSSFKDGVWDGYFPRVWKELAQRINSTTKAFRSKDNSTGSKNKNGTWSGLVGMALRGEIDVLVSELSMNAERSSVLKFTIPVLVSRYQIYFPSSGRRLKWRSVLEPFSRKVWLALLAWIGVGTIFLATVYYVSWSYGPDKNCIKMFGLKDSFFFILQSLCSQGMTLMPKSTACRIVIFCSFFVSCILISSYSAAIVSSLTLCTPSRPFDTLKDMLLYGKFKLLVLPRTGQYSYFESAKTSLHSKVFRKLVRTTIPDGTEIKSIADVFEKVFCRVDQHAFFTVEKIFHMKREHSDALPCPLVTLAERLNLVFQSLAVAKDSPFNNLFNYHLQQMYNFGIIHRIERSIRRVHEPEEVDFRGVTIEDTFFIFTILTLGLVLSLVILVIEVTCSRRKGGRRKQINSTKIIM